VGGGGRDVVGGVRYTEVPDQYEVVRIYDRTARPGANPFWSFPEDSHTDSRHIHAPLLRYRLDGRKRCVVYF